MDFQSKEGHNSEHIEQTYITDGQITFGEKIIYSRLVMRKRQGEVWCDEIIDLCKMITLIFIK